ncbi:MAG: ORF6N domain-containing protein [Actinobacteria bacterium]|nr:ORF6N domain-containing protein [Actinomycetota bacterium]
MPDTDLATLYGVEVKALNQAVARNAERFPTDFIFRLSCEEAVNLKSHTPRGGRSGPLLQRLLSRDSPLRPG